MKEYKIFTKDRHEYTVVVKELDAGTKYTIKFSENASWTFPGKECISMIDDGNGNFIFSEKLGKIIDYSLFIELKLLFNVACLDQKNLSESYYAIDCSKTNEV